MPASRTSNAALLQKLHGRKVADVTVEEGKLLRVQFADGAVLSVSQGPNGLAVEVAIEPARSQGGAPRPTARQSEYLAFIARYIQRFGIAPAEVDMQRHFLVSAPTVNQMMQMLQRRGFITREPGVARSIRLCIDIADD